MPIPLRAGAGVPSIDLNRLAAFDRDAAEVGAAINMPQYGGVDFDRNPAVLTWAEFEAGAPVMLQAFPGPANEAAALRLQNLFLGEPAPSGPTGNGAGAPPNPLLTTAWGAQLAVDLSDSLAAGRTIAHGGVSVSKTAVEGSATLAFPFPASRAGQTVDSTRVEFHVVDAQGRPLDAVESMRVAPLDRNSTEKSLLRVRFDLSKLPAEFFIRWSVPVTTVTGLVDLGAPVPLPTRASLPANARPWLEPAPMIQSDHPSIRQLAAQIRSRANSVQSLATETLAAIASLRLPPAADDFQNDALSFLRTGQGECVAHSNLFAALMRANGVPTRVVTGIQRGAGQNMHYRNEYFLPGQGWVFVEPQGRVNQASRADWVDTGIVYPRMERQGRGFAHYDGVPQLSMIAQEVTAAGEPVPEAERRLSIASGLVVRNIPFAGTPIHGAG